MLEMLVPLIDEKRWKDTILIGTSFVYLGVTAPHPLVSSPDVR
jgi:hypothetical protein